MADPFDSWLDSRPADESPSDGELLPGTRIGACKVVALLGRGAFGEVYRGEDVDGRPVAIKILHRLDDKARARFELETKVLLQIRHPNFPQMLSFGSCGERPYVVMELLKAYELPNKDRAVACFLRKVIAAVGELHRHGWVHRDVKPANLLMREDGELVLADFGLVCPLSNAERERNALSVENELKVGVGTKPYAAPEQFNGQPVGRPADVHAIGMLIRDCFGDRMPKCWERIFLSATNTNPEIRYQTVGELSKAISRRHLLKTLVVVAVVVVVGAVLAEILWAPVANMAEEKRDDAIPTFFAKPPTKAPGLMPVSSEP